MTGKPTFRSSSTPQGLTENMQILTGQKGDRLDKALTMRDAAELGMLQLHRNAGGAIVPALPPTKAIDPEWTGVQAPAAPANVSADGAFHTISLTWDIPGYRGHAFAEVLRGDEDNPAKAVVIGSTLANVYADPIGKGLRAYYWVRFVNKNGVVGPLHDVSGVMATTSSDVGEILASAHHFALYNPARPTRKEVIFGVTDEGLVGIREAVIRAATIQIIHSEKITADYIKAGVSISSPLITGGQIDMGNAFMAGGAAGFGKGGPYGGWGWGWHSIIYADGSFYTNRLRAEGGHVRNMVIGNCTIEQDCVVRGTVYADRIVGDVTAIKSLNIGSPTAPFSLFFHVVAANFTRGVVISGINLSASGYYYGGGGQPSEGSRTCTAVFYMNGVEISRSSASASGGSNKDSVMACAVATLPAGVHGSFHVSFLGDISVSLVGALAMVFKQGSATFG